MPMRLNGSSIRADNATYWVADGQIISLDPGRGEVHGEFMLQNNERIARGHGTLTIVVDFPLEVRKLASLRKSDGSHRYRFVAECDADVFAALDLMLNPVKMPTMLEEYIDEVTILTPIQN